jgi:hypothetical protein
MLDKLGNNIPARINGKANPEYSKIQNKKYHLEHPKYSYNYLKNWQQNNKEKTHKYNKKCREKHKEQYNNHNKEYMKKDRIINRKKYLIYNQEYNEKIRIMRVNILNIFGNKCSNPYNIDHSSFEKDINYKYCLQIDHINGGGKKQRKEFKGANNIRYFNYIINNLSEHQLLCANCNWMKRIVNNEIKISKPSILQKPNGNWLKRIKNREDKTRQILNTPITSYL